ncbi:hypothetical protein QMK33_08590 [Hymenobacter sp. H14-R3]|uniref:hypothetical protein n=1 Tax=Hymenobacter sp. H14-R3 TaxID=3046308 RepID=UPI0024B8DFAC|nr:hypothetical protein [Hymenobacter sp. H14-R3]MDJ0365208.1 hypothetical protein [Hymenobacter sp. H14-R3]
MKRLMLLVSLLLLLLVLPPAGHSAHHRRHHYPVSCGTARLLPLRVVRTPAVAQQHRLVRAVR